ncbi:MAG: Tol-Pal system beta propeller repeat protein TolB [Proteobacteria bacterium]|nr:Tol-Pal system beta propeller repeat protein TolB [Pseudomonadota bacterium]
MGLLFLLIAFQAHARLNIEITQGEARGVPIAIASSVQEHSHKTNHVRNSFEELAGIIRNDLKMSGRFDPLYPEQFPILRTIEQELEVASWQSIGAENLVLGSVQATGNDFYTVSFKLLDVYNTPAQIPQQNGDTVNLKSGNGTILVEKVYKGIRQQDFRALAHHISDVIYERLTGIRGAFSTRIAYVMVVKTMNGNRYSLEVADADGFNPVTLVKSHQPIMSPSWSADGRRLAYVSFEKNRAEIYFIDVATGKRELLSHFSGINGAPAWSPDGRQLALVLSKTGNPKLYLMNIANKTLTQLTEGYSIDTEPAWSPNGRALYFTSNRGGKPQIYRLDIATRQVERVTFIGNYNARPMLTADGKYLVMMHREDRSDQFHIASLDLTSGQVAILTHARLDESPTLSPNGAMVLYGTQDGDRQILGLVTLDGRGQLRLPAREGSVQEPAWSPFLS